MNEDKLMVKCYIDFHNVYVKKFGKNKMTVLMQVGSFYEVYNTGTEGPNLEELEEITDVSIAHKGRDKTKVNVNNPLMWGFPMVATDKYIGLLIENGYTLVIVDQITQKPNIKREVVSILSPSTYLEQVFKPSSNNIVNVYIEEIVSKTGIITCVGLCAIDVSTGKVIIHETFSDSSTDDKLALDETSRFINSILPKEIIIYTDNLKKNTQQSIVEYLEIKNYQFKELNKDYCKIVFQKKILEKAYPSRKSLTNIIDTLELSKTIYATKALVLLLVYISDFKDSLITNLEEPVFDIDSNKLVLGNDAINQLNIVDNNSTKNDNLLDVINSAETPMGKRYVKSRLVSPYTETQVIQNIYDTVENILHNDYHIVSNNYLKKIGDIERLYRKIVLQIIHPMHFLEFINSFKVIEELYNSIHNNVKLTKIIKVGNIIPKLEELNEYIKQYINIGSIQRFTLNDISENIFNEGIYTDLDALQAQKNSTHDVINELTEKIDEILGDGKKTQLMHNKINGNYYQMTIRRHKSLMDKIKDVKKIKLSSLTIDVKDITSTTIGKNVKITLPFLRNQTNDIDELQTKITTLTKTYYIDFLKTIYEEHNNTIKNIISTTTLIDYYTCIAKVSFDNNYVKPIINNDLDKTGYVIGEKIRHPIVERIIGHEYIPHDIVLGRDIKGMLIYGLNSAGKSVLMKAVGIAVIMAQAGFYVPAKSFVFYPYKSLYTRITGTDDLYRGMSSFTVEMVELNAILKRSSSTTLVIGDEIARGTEHISGSALVATAILKLSESSTTFLFATHLHELMDLEEIQNRKNIKAVHLSVSYDDKTDKLVYDRILKDGSGEKIYGITVAKYIIKDTNFINKALEIKNVLTGLNKDVKVSRYNKDLLVDECSICGKKNGLETHHINLQKDCTIKKDFVKDKPHIKRNQLFNLVVLCEKCHDKLHDKKIKVESIKMTGKGLTTC